MCVELSIAGGSFPEGPEPRIPQPVNTAMPSRPALCNSSLLIKSNLPASISSTRFEGLRPAIASPRGAHEYIILSIWASPLPVRQHR